ncbi:MAG: hypothetical protein KHW79_10185 [Clostridiales bacterium]|nr:hypothetical protein [Clostridiales bacterium]
MWNLVSLGELLVDFTPMGMSTAGNPVFERNPGGGPTNLACAAAKLGVRTAFIGQVGDDTFGRAFAFADVSDGCFFFAGKIRNYSVDINTTTNIYKTIKKWYTKAG